MALEQDLRYFFPREVAAVSARIEGWFVFVDSLGVCRLTAAHPGLTLGCVTG
jgi:hypothetical protein